MTAAAPANLPASVPLARFGALSFTYFAAVGLFNPYAPLWFQALGFSTLTIGAIASLQAWTRVVVPYAWSWAADHSGRRIELIRLSACGALLAAAALMGVQAALPVAVATTLLFVANSGVQPLSEAALVHLLHRPDAAGGIDSARYGRVRVWGSIGFIAAVTAFGALLDRSGVGIFPAFVALLNAAMLVAAMRLPAVRDEAHHDAPAPPVLPLLRRPALAWFFASIFFTVLAHNSLYAFFSLYLVALGYGKAAIGGLWALGVAVEVLFFWTQGRWFGRLSPLRWLVLVGLVTAARFAATAAFGANVPVLLLCQATHAITFAAHHTACISLVNRHFPGRLRGRGQALYTALGYGLSGLIGGVGGGWLISKLGFAAVFWAASSCGLVAAGCAVLSARADAQTGAG